ncbi:BatD family protein [Thalassotalea hakodatensis]|uniref:BatD family protein n=1 Tax=Thalassotalea hakodatensis TaxID=3030492 RepID=UPI0025725A41|nr:BatD family protein [Thalassotalea hakodatensis]
MVKVLTALLTLFITVNAYALTEVTATIDKNPVIVNESFVLTVVANDDVDTNALDTSALMQDFIVGRTSVSSQTSMVNFKTTRTTRWTTVLIARKAGNYTIPPLTVDGVTTKPIDVKVINASENNTDTQQTLFITTDISAKDVYVQQQLTLTIKLHFAAELKRGSLTEPELEGANITQVGKDKEGETIINGIRYRVIERTYAISPQKSGEFTLKSPVFSGEIMVPSTRRNSFLSFAETKPVSVIGEEIPINVNAIPTNYQGTWLPSELLSIHQEWQPNVTEFKVGEPITRVITLTAAGLSEEQLPELEMLLPAGLKVYPDQAELHTGMNNNRLVSQKVRNFAIVANKPGNYQLPEMVIPWWNTVTNEYQEAVIPAQIITIAANTEQPEFVLPPNEAQITPTQTPIEKTVYVEKASILQWVFLALWLLTLLAWLITYQKQKSTQKTAVVSKVNDHYLGLLAACKKHNSEQVFTHLLPWYNSLNLQSVSTISQLLASTNNQPLIAAIEELQLAKYGQAPIAWQGDNLAKAIQQVNKTQSTQQQNNGFQLNP